jgi:hypothetical protein
MAAWVAARLVRYLSILPTHDCLSSLRDSSPSECGPPWCEQDGRYVVAMDEHKAAAKLTPRLNDTGVLASYTVQNLPMVEVMHATYCRAPTTTLGAGVHTPGSSGCRCCELSPR